MKMVSVAEVMTRNPVAVKPDDLVTHARSVFRKYGFRALPVVEGGRLVGMISRGDVMLVTSTKANLSVRGVMSSNVTSAKPADSLDDTAKVLVKLDLRQLPVVDAGVVVGIVSARDILQNFLESRQPSSAKVAEIMTQNVVSCSPEDDLSSLWSKMRVHGFGGLPVVEKKAVKGMITRMDVIRHSSTLIGKESGKPKSIKVRKVMNSPAITVRPGDKVSKAANILVEKKIIRLPVVDDKKKLLGIIDIDDVIKAYMS